MIQAVKQQTIVGKDGEIKLNTPQFSEGTAIEIIILVNSIPEDTTEFLRALDFVNSVEIREEKLNISQEEDFFQLAGLWENRDLTTESIRQEAWKTGEKS